MNASTEIAGTIDRPTGARSGAGPLAALAFLVLLCLAYSINAADRQIFPTLLPAIRQTFGYDLKIAGLLATIFTLGLAVAGLPAGHIVDRISRKTIILIAMVIYSAFTLATIFAQGFWDMLFYRAITGIGEGMQMAALFAAIGSYFHRRRSFFIGWLIVAYGVGAFLGPRVGAILAASASSWQAPFVWFAGAGLLIAALVLAFVPREFTESAGPQRVAAGEEASLAHVPEGLWNRNVFLGVVGCIILGYSLYGFISLYTTYLKEALSFSQADAAAAFSYFGFGGLVSFAGGYIGDRLSQRWVTALAFALLAAVSFVMYNGSASSQSQSVLSFLVGALGSGVVFVNLLSLLQRSVRPQLSARLRGFFSPRCSPPGRLPAIFSASWSANSAGAARH